MRALLLVAPLFLLTACAQSGGGAAAQPTADSPTPASGDSLIVTVDRGDGREPEKYTLSCDGGQPSTHPDAEPACAHLAGLTDPFAPIPSDAVCTEIYGGPQTARITGTWAGEPVDLGLSRVDGCRIAQWERLGPLLPGPVGAAAPS